MHQPENQMPDVAQWWPEIEVKVAKKKKRNAQLKTTALFVASVCVAVVSTVSFFEFRNRNQLAISGSPCQSVWLPVAQTRDITFSDKSNITLLPMGELHLLEIGEKKVELQLNAGRAKFAVTPGGPRKWSIDTRLARVQVIGTEFFVESREHDVSVQVTHGIVSVSGRCVEGGEVKLTKGEQLQITDSCLFEPVKAVQLNAPDLIPKAVDSIRIAKPIPLEPQALAVPTRVDTEIEIQKANQILQEAESLRRLNKFSQAISRCENVVATYPLSREASLAAFLAGRIAQESLNDWPRAGRFFEQAVHLKIDSALEGDALRRSIENYERAHMSLDVERMKAFIK
jgi:transmembrane sensor